MKIYRIIVHVPCESCRGEGYSDPWETISFICSALSVEGAENIFSFLHLQNGRGELLSIALIEEVKQ